MPEDAEAQKEVKKELAEKPAVRQALRRPGQKFQRPGVEKKG